MPMLRSMLVLLCLLALSACAHYYRVTDPGSGKSFYTEEVKRDGSAVTFKDSQTGAQTTLQNSQVLEISGKDYQAGVGKK